MEIRFPKWPVIVICAFFLFPIFGQAGDGGSVSFTAVLYQIELPHAMIDEDHYRTGICVSILGFDVYERTQVVPVEALTW